MDTRSDQLIPEWMEELMGVDDPPVRAVTPPQFKLLKETKRVRKYVANAGDRFSSDVLTFTTAMEENFTALLEKELCRLGRVKFYMVLVTPAYCCSGPMLILNRDEIRQKFNEATEKALNRMADLTNEAPFGYQDEYFELILTVHRAPKHPSKPKRQRKRFVVECFNEDDS
jgi:hypothetical protein